MVRATFYYSVFQMPASCAICPGRDAPLLGVGGGALPQLTSDPETERSCSSQVCVTCPRPPRVYLPSAAGCLLRPASPVWNPHEPQGVSLSPLPWSGTRPRHAVSSSPLPQSGTRPSRRRSPRPRFPGLESTRATGLLRDGARGQAAQLALGTEL